MTVTPDQIAAWNADKTVMSGRNKIADAGVVAGWSTLYSHSTNITDAAYPAIRGYDGKTHLSTRPAAFAGTFVYFHVDFGVATTVDMAAIISSNLSTAVDLVISVFGSDDAAFTTGVVDVGTNIITSNRALFTNTGHIAHTKRYWAFEFDFGVGPSIIPSILEIYLGERLQMPRKPATGYDASLVSGVADVFTSQSGVSTAFTHRKNQRVVNASWQLKTDEAAAVDAWSNDIMGGSFIFCDNPSTAKNDFYLMRRDELLSHAMPTSGPFSREFTLAAIEQGSAFLGNQ